MDSFVRVNLYRFYVVYKLIELISFQYENE